MAAARRRLRDVIQLAKIDGPDDGMQFTTDLLLGLLALDFGLSLARHYLANAPGAAADFPEDPAALDISFESFRMADLESVPRRGSW